MSDPITGGALLFSVFVIVMVILPTYLLAKSEKCEICGNKMEWTGYDKWSCPVCGNSCKG